MEDAWRKKAMAMALSMALVSCAVSGMAMGMVGGGESETPNSMSFQECYGGCFILCAIQPTRTLSSCGFECLMDCIIPSSSSSVAAAQTQTPFHFCRLGCASVRCTNISTLNHPGAKQVAACLGSCSGLCTN